MDNTPLKTESFNNSKFTEEELGLKQEKNQKLKYFIIGGLILAAIIVAIVVVVILITKDRKEDEEEKRENRKPRSLLEKLRSKKTPYYYYNTTRLNETVTTLLDLAKKDNIKIHFSLKSNFNEKVLKFFQNYPDIGIDCVSGGEVNYSLTQGFPHDKIVFAGIGKTEEEIEFAVEKGIFCINVESFEELENLNKICNKLNKKMNFGVRINPNIAPHTHDKIVTGSNETKFGIYIDECKDEFYNKIEEIFFHKNPNYNNLNFIGLHFHIGSQILNFSDYIPLCEKIDKYIGELNERKIVITYLNLGGGLGVDYDEPDLHPIPDFKGFFDTYLTNIKSLQKIGPNFNNNTKITLHFELGRSMIAQSGLLISTVIYVKRGIHKNFTILDAGMNDLVRPAMYGALHQIAKVKDENDVSDEKETYDVVGPICESSDVFAKNYTMDKLNKSDLVMIKSAGAYGESMASRYNYRKLVEGYMDYELDY